MVKARGASLKATEQPIDASTAISKCFLDMLGVFAKFEPNLRREQQVIVAKLFICFARVSLRVHLRAIAAKSQVSETPAAFRRP